MYSIKTCLLLKQFSNVPFCFLFNFSASIKTRFKTMRVCRNLKMSVRRTFSLLYCAVCTPNNYY